MDKLSDTPVDRICSCRYSIWIGSDLAVSQHNELHRRLLSAIRCVGTCCQLSAEIRSWGDVPTLGPIVSQKLLTLANCQYVSSSWHGMGNHYPRFLRPRHGADSISVLQIWVEGSREVQVRAGAIRKKRTFDIWGKGIALLAHRFAYRKALIIILLIAP